MKKKEKNMSFNFDIDVIINYVETINSIKEPMCQIKKELKLNSESKYKKDKVVSKSFESIIKMNNQIKTFLIEYPNMHYKIYTDTIKQIMKINKGMISTRMIEPLNISRQYLLLMENNNDIEKVSRGIYLSPNAFEDSYFCFQQKYKKVVFSNMNALYFYGMT